MTLYAACAIRRPGAPHRLPKPAAFLAAACTTLLIGGRSRQISITTRVSGLRLVKCSRIKARSRGLISRLKTISYLP